MSSDINEDQIYIFVCPECHRKRASDELVSVHCSGTSANQHNLVQDQYLLKNISTLDEEEEAAYLIFVKDKVKKESHEKDIKFAMYPAIIILALLNLLLAWMLVAGGGTDFSGEEIKVYDLSWWMAMNMFFFIPITMVVFGLCLAGKKLFK